ncbi:hypothetical protein [Lysobacter capsici]|uniref:hypothetical protein n=1 Tax=Lysobacter capsici TaxID=435897 RepID=UPI001BFFDF4B|nr:hypothetical protein [Lysobacter capsici]QWF17128.1 hypothetical protein KME82_25960 [Lysobacter capsici]
MDFQCVPPDKPSRGSGLSVSRSPIALHADAHALFPRFPICVLAALLAGCSSMGSGATATKESAEHPASALSSPQQGSLNPMQRMTAIKKGVDDLASGDISNVGFVDSYLSVHLKEESDNGKLTVRRGNGGTFAGLAVSSVELRTMKDNASHNLLIIDLAEPGPEASTFVRTFWPDADFVPARPHAPGSAAYWSAKQGASTIKIGRPSDKDQITSIVFNRMP